MEARRARSLRAGRAGRAGRVARPLAQRLAFVLALGAASACRYTCNSDEASADASAPFEAGAYDATPIPFNEETTVKVPDALVQTRRDGTIPNRYVVPSEDQRAVMRAAIKVLFARGADGRAEAQSKLEPIGFEVADLADVPGAVLVREQDGKKRGGGAYVIRLGDTQKVVVETPHTFFDEGTFPLGFDFFQKTHARAWFLNTMHRYKGAPAGPDDVHPSDVAHAPNSLFQAATEGVIEALGAPTVIQLHGFADRETGGGRAVISTGEKAKGNPFLAKMKASIEGAAGPGILRYPDDSQELGATTNVQGLIVRNAKGRFFHMEMSEGLRRELLVNDSLRTRTWSAVSSVLEAQ